MIPSPDSEPYLFPLPQYGFGSDINFKTLLPNNPFLYRVYTPKERSPFFDDTEPYFVAPKFDEAYARTPVEVTSASIVDPLDASYADIAVHMEWTTRNKSPFLSASFSFAWSIWEAVRRYHQGMKKDVEIAIIDASVVMGRAATGVQLLRKSLAEERDQQYAKWYRFAQESQSVLIHGLVPGTAVLASIPLVAILERLPPYYLRSKTPLSPTKPLDHLGWNYADKKHNYRQFCQEITNRFFAQSQEIRFRDATGGSMRLALTLLRPWFHRMVTQDFKLATNTLHTLAIVIAHWGGQWWATEHSELSRILDAMAKTLGEELLQRFEREDQEEIHRLQYTVDTLERVIRRHETKRLIKPTAGISRGACCSSPSTPESSPKVRPRRTLSMSVHMPPSREVANVQTPITPPESPRYSEIFSRNVDLEYLPSTIVFQPFTPPLDWPSVASGPSTPVALQSILSPVAEVATPTGDSALEVDVETKVQRVLQTPMAIRKPQYLPSPESTPPVILDSLMRDGFRTRTISDLSSGLRIEIPGVEARRLVFSPSPVDSFQDTRNRPVSMESSLTTLAPPSPPAVLEKFETPTSKTSLGSPVALKMTWEDLPPLPLAGSPTTSWGSVSTLPPSRAPSPKITPPPTEDSDAITLLPSASGPAFRPIKSLPSICTGSPHHSLSSSPSALNKPLPISRASSTCSTPLSEYLVTPTDVKPQRGEILYRVPKPPLSILSSPAVAVDDYERAERRARQGPILVETGAFIVTGFLVGAFVTLFLISTQRRTLLSLT